MTTQEIITRYLEGVAEAIKTDAVNKGQKIPADSFEVRVGNDGTVSLLAADYFQYLVFGRGPGKMPPVEKIQAWAKKIPLKGLDDLGRFITDKSLAWAIAKKIAREGTDIFQGKKPGIDLLGAMNVGLDDMMDKVGDEKALQFANILVKDIEDGPNRRP